MISAIVSADTTISDRIVFSLSRSSFLCVSSPMALPTPCVLHAVVQDSQNESSMAPADGSRCRYKVNDEDFGTSMLAATNTIHLVGFVGNRNYYAANSSSSAFASFRSRVSNPSVNHP
jgi:hypothetical protein